MISNIALFVCGAVLHFVYRYWEWLTANPKKSVWAYFVKFKRSNVFTIVLQVAVAGWWIGGYEIGGINLSAQIPVTWSMALLVGWASDSFIKANLHKLPMLKTLGGNGGS